MAEEKTPEPIIDIAPDKIPVLSFDEIIQLKNILSYPRIISGVIEAPLIKTSATGPRIIIEKNDIYIFDDSTGGTTPITGDTASIFFPRTDDEDQRFIIRKRAGKNYDEENVMEMFYENAASGSEASEETELKSPASNKTQPPPKDAYPWTNPTYAYYSNNYYATASQGDIKYHCWYNFSMNIPPAAIILGITVKIEAKATPGSGSPSPKLIVYLTKDAANAAGNSRTTSTLTTSDAIYTLGGAADLWGTTWTSSNFKTNFGVLVEGDTSSSPTPTDYSIDNIQIKVTYNFPPDFPRENYIFMGRAGDQTPSQSKTDAISLTTNQIFELCHSSSASPLWYVISSSYSGAQKTEMWGQGLEGGTRGWFTFKDMGTELVFSDSPNFKVWDTITGNSSGATAYIGAKTDANHYTAVFVNGTFDPDNDNACTTNGAGGGSGTGNLDSLTSTEFNMVTGEGGGVMAFGHQAKVGDDDYISAQLWLDAYNIWFDDDIKPYTDNTWDIGSADHQVKDIYIAGSIIGAGWENIATITEIVSDNVRNSNDTEKATGETSYTIIKECKLNEDLPACRIYFELRSGTGGFSANAQIYKNGEIIGTEQGTVLSTWTGYDEDFTSFVKDDLIQIYAKASAGKTSRVQNFRFKYDQRITHIANWELTTPVEVTEQPISITNQDP